MPLGSFAALVLPLLALEEREIDAPDEHRSAPFHSPRRIDGVAPHDVPTRVIVVRLNCPRTRTALRFQSFPWWRVEFTLQGKIGKRCCATSGCLCLLYGLKESSALTPMMPTTALKMLACSRYRSISSSAFSSTKSMAFLRCAMVRPGGNSTARSKPSLEKAKLGFASSVQEYNIVLPNALLSRSSSVHGERGECGDSIHSNVKKR